MRALLAAMLLLAPLASVPPASALDPCTRYLIEGDLEPIRFAWCAARVDMRPPPEPPEPGDPPQAFVDWAQLMVVWAVCATNDPPTVEINEKCDDSIIDPAYLP